MEWPELPGFPEEALNEAWNAWLKGWERPGQGFGPLCGDVRRLSIGEPQEQREWLMARLQPYRVEATPGGLEGLLTAYFEPELEASRPPDEPFRVPPSALPPGTSSAQPLPLIPL